MKRRTLLGLGATLVGAGAASQSGAFDTVAGERPASIRSAADPDAFLGLDGYTDPAETPIFTNRLANPLEITLTSTDPGVEFDVGDTDSFEPVPVTFTLQPGETTLTPVNGGKEVVSVDITAHELVSGSPAGTITLTRSFAVPQAGQIEITPDVKSAGSSGRYLFGLTNTGSIDAILEAVGIVSTSTENATKVGGRSGDKVLVWDNENEQLLTTIMAFDSSTDEAENVYPLDTKIPFDAVNNGGDEQILEFDRFRHEDNANADMRGATVTIFLKFEDQSTTVKLAVDE